jgi:hypothetical protein
VADLGELSREFVRDEPVGGQPALDEFFEGADLAGLEAVGITKYPDWEAPAPSAFECVRAASEQRSFLRPATAGS